MPRPDSPPAPATPAALTPESVRRRLRALVAASGRTQADVAASAGWTPQRLSDLLTGRRATPTVATVGRLLAALGRDWADLDG